MTKPMRFLISILLISSLLAGRSYGQAGTPDQRVLSRTVKEQANEMAKAFIKEDFQSFVHYTNPALLRMVGGEDKMTDQLAKTVKGMKAQGMAFNGVTFGDVSKIIKSGNQLQCTLPQHTEVKLSNGRVVATSTLIAISTDGGKAWTFVDTSNKDITAIRRLLPNLSSSITIPQQQPPVRYNN